MQAKTLFDLYSKNFALVREKYSIKLPADVAKDFAECVVCPTCLNMHNATCLDPQSEFPLTVEHLPSEKLAGKPLILTCRPCNNRAGAKLDSALKLFYKVEPFVTGKENSSVDATITIGGNFKARTTVTQKTIDGKPFFDFKHRINKERMDKYNELLKNIHGEEFRFTFWRPNSRNVEIAILRIGYLLAFAKLGHSFVVGSGNHQNIREQIANPDKKILPSFGACASPKLPINEQGLFILIFDDGFKCTYVSFEIEHEGKKEMIGVMLPPSKVNDLDFYNTYAKLVESKALKAYRSAKLYREDYLYNPDGISEIHNIYNAIEAGKLK